MKDKIKKITKSRVFTLFEILLFIAVCMGTGALMSFVKHESDPTEQAVEYFRAFVQRDYNKMYSYIERKEGYYINETMYKAEMKKQRESMVIDTYDIKEPEKKDGVKQVEIVCTDSEADKSRSFVIKFAEKRKGIQLIPDYYVNIDDMFVENITVVMKKNNYLELNGEKITDKMADIGTNLQGHTVYTLKGVLKGRYKAAATNEYYSALQYVDLEKQGTEVDLTKQGYTANEKYTKLILAGGQNVVEKFYAAVRNRKPDDKKLIECFENNKKLKSKVRDAVESSQDVVYWPDVKNIDSYKVIDFEMSTLKPVIKYFPTKRSYELTYTYSYEYVSSTDTALYTSYVYSLSGKCSSTMKLTYTLKGENIVLTDIKIKNKNKKEGQ